MWLENLLAEGEHATRLRSDLPYFAEHAPLKLRPKAGPLEQFVFNAAQRKLHDIAEAQKAKTGKVRLIVLKARQLGVSTYVAARSISKHDQQPRPENIHSQVIRGKRARTFIRWSVASTKTWLRTCGPRLVPATQRN